ncbi:MAG TPA: ankyrin repeat domain-containing protein [Candidatus Ozemobacteraceae bacterium]|nr:ankyrin repeat domain-containing protein [Candidatus Ozemobacteraceae bacterium]
MPAAHLTVWEPVIEANDSEAASRLLEGGATLTATDSCGRSIVHLIACTGADRVFHAIRADLPLHDSPDAFGRLPLHDAALNGHAPLIDPLMNRCHGPSPTDQDGFTPLHEAVLGDHLAVVELLLARGAVVHLPNKRGILPLHLATSVPVIKTLVRAGADLNATDHRRNTFRERLLACGPTTLAREVLAAFPPETEDEIASLLSTLPEFTLDFMSEWKTFDRFSQPLKKAILFAAARYRKREVWTTLFWSGMGEDQHDEQGNSLLEVAAESGDTALVERLIESGFQPTPARTRAKTLLHLAAGSGNAETVEVLLQRGCDPLAQCGPGETPLWFAVVKDAREVIPVLVKAGANPNLPGPNGEYPLFLAFTFGRTELIECLLNHGADPHVTDSYGNTILHQAAHAKNGELVRVLLRHGADPMRKNKSGITAFEEIQKSCPVEVAMELLESLRAKGVTIKGLRPLLGMVPDVSRADSLLQLGAQVQDVGDDGSTPLHMQAESGNLAMVSFLLEHGASPTAARRDGATALHLAAAQAHPGVVERLIAARARVNATDTAGRVPLVYACEALKERDPLSSYTASQVYQARAFADPDSEKLDRIIRLLIDAGADLFVPVGERPFIEWARGKGMARLSKTLAEILASARSSSTLVNRFSIWLKKR